MSVTITVGGAAGHLSDAPIGVVKRLSELGGYANKATVLWSLWTPPGSSATLAAIGGSDDVNIELDVPGNYRVRLTFTDTAGATSTDDLLLRVLVPWAVPSGDVSGLPAPGEKLELDATNGWQKQLNAALRSAGMLAAAQGTINGVLLNDGGGAIPAGAIVAVRSVKAWAELTAGGTGAIPTSGETEWVPTSQDLLASGQFAFVPQAIPAGDRGEIVFRGLSMFDTSAFGVAGSLLWAKGNGANAYTIGKDPDDPTASGSTRPLKVGVVVVQAATSGNPAGFLYFDPTSLHEMQFRHRELSTIAKGWSGAALGNVVACNGADTVQKADASDPTKMPAVGIVVGLYANDVVEIQRFGSNSLGTVTGGPPTAGQVLYVDTTPGAMVATPPASPAQTQVVGVALAGDLIAYTLSPPSQQREDLVANPNAAGGSASDGDIESYSSDGGGNVRYSRIRTEQSGNVTVFLGTGATTAAAKAAAVLAFTVAGTTVTAATLVGSTAVQDGIGTLATVRAAVVTAQSTADTAVTNAATAQAAADAAGAKADALGAEDADGEVPIPILGGWGESGTWSKVLVGGVPAVRRTAAAATEKYWCEVVLPVRAAAGKGAKPTGIAVHYQVDTAALNDVLFELHDVTNGDDNSAPNSPDAVLCGAVDGEYDSEHNTAGKRGDDTGRPENHKAVITIAAPAYLAVRRRLMLEITVNGTATGVFTLSAATLLYSRKYNDLS